MTGTARLACAVLAHADPVQLHRLVAALDPLPVMLHIDAGTPDDVHAQMVAGLPDRVVLVPRVRTRWATFGAVRAELLAYRAALASTDATHVAWLSGADYPLMSVDDMQRVLSGQLGRSFADVRELPISYWGMGGGLGRLRYRHWQWRRHVVRLPVPRRLPAGLVPAGGPAQKVLARHHVEAILRAVDERPELLRFWQRVWAPDETFTPTILATPSLVPGWAHEHEQHLAWCIDWTDHTQSPPWLTMDHLDRLRESRAAPGALPRFFARKVHSSASAELLDAVDLLRTEPIEWNAPEPG